MERHFERELSALKSSLIRMGSTVDEQLENAARALLEADPARAAKVIARDHEVDMFDNSIDRECQRIFALAQPVAIDLRLLMSALKINTQLERIGDIAVNIAERVEPLLPFHQFVGSTRLHEMAGLARVMTRDALDSFVHGDASIAQRVLESDDVVDEMDAGIFRHMVREMEAHPALAVPAAHIIVLSRHIERLADHATNIAEDVIFLVEARMVKHHADAGEGRPGPVS